MSSNQNKTVVIVGGGVSGIGLLNELKKKPVNIVLLTQNNFYYHNIAAVRIPVDGTLADQIAIPYDRVVKGPNVRFIQGKLSSIGDNSIEYVKINGDEENDLDTLNFDYLVLGLGCQYPQPFRASHYDRDTQINYLKSFSENMKNSNSVLIIGSGTVGIETACEIAFDQASKNKKVTLVSHSSRAIADFSEKLSEKIMNFISKNPNVEFLFNDSVDIEDIPNFTTQKITTRNGREIEFDAYLTCHGNKPNTSFIKNVDWLDERGFIKVNKYFQVLNHDNIFAMGDCCNIEQAKLAYVAGLHSPVVAHNIDQLLRGRNKLKDYSNDKKATFVSLGRNDGAFQFGNFVAKSFVVTLLKSKNLFVSKYRSMLGY